MIALVQLEHLVHFLQFEHLVQVEDLAEVEDRQHLLGRNLHEAGAHVDHLGVLHARDFKM